LGEQLHAVVDIRDLENHTPLLLAAGTNQETPGHVEVVKQLLAMGASVNATDDGQYSSLHLAVLNSNFQIAQALLEAKCDVNHVNLDKFTALHSACTQANVKLIHLLLSFGADPTLKDARGKTPADFARRTGISLPTDPIVVDREKPDELIRAALAVKVETTPQVQLETDAQEMDTDASSIAVLNEIQEMTGEKN